MDLTRQGYYYHPLGNLAKELLNNPADKIPYVNDGDEESKVEPSGVGNLEYSTTAQIPGGVEVYAMATGTIYNIEANEKGFNLYLRTNKQDSTGEVICIKYSFLGGLSDDLATAAGVNSGAMSKEEVAKLTISTTVGSPVSAGDKIGYTNNWDDKCMLRVSFIYRQSEENVSTDYEDFKDKLPHLTGIDNVNEKFTFTKIENSIAQYSVKCEDELVGTESGMTQLTDGSASKHYPIYPFLSYLVLHQKPVYCESIGPEGGIPMVGASDVINSQNMDQTALNFYLSGTIGEQWIGSYPNTIEDVNNNAKGLRYAVAVCSQELNFDTFSGVSYAKLIRAKMIGEPWQSGNDMKAWFEGLDPSQFDGKPIWLAKTFDESDLQYAQLVYMNLRYPGLYGSELFEGSQEFYNAIVYGCQQVPIYNLSPVAYHPLSFCVNFNVKSNKDEGDRGGAGNFLMYRQIDGDMKGFNNKVQG